MRSSVSLFVKVAIVTACLGLVGCGDPFEEESLEFEFNPEPVLKVHPQPPVVNSTVTVQFRSSNTNSLQAVFKGILVHNALAQVLSIAVAINGMPVATDENVSMADQGLLQVEAMSNVSLGPGSLAFRYFKTTNSVTIPPLALVTLTLAIQGNAEKFAAFAGGAACPLLSSSITDSGVSGLGLIPEFRFAQAVFRVVSTSPDLIITEVHTAAPRFVEVLNVSAAPVAIAGTGVMTSDNGGCPSFTSSPQMNGGYVSSRNFQLSPGQYYTFVEGGVAGDPNLPASISGAGEHLGFPLSWDDLSPGEVGLYVNASVGSDARVVGTSRDYVRFRTLGGTAIVDAFRHRPPGLGGRWYSAAAERPTGHDSLQRLFIRDSDTARDWNALTAPTAGLPNPPGTVSAAVPSGMDLDVFAPAPGALRLQVSTASPGLVRTRLFNLFSFVPLACAGSGPLVGLSADALQLAMVPPGTEPFVVRTDFKGEYRFDIAGLPPGIPMQVRSAAIRDQSELILSNIVDFVTQ